MNCPCQNCPERRLVCHDHCPAYLEYHETRVAILESRRRDSRVISYLTENYYARERAVKAKRIRR